MLIICLMEFRSRCLEGGKNLYEKIGISCRQSSRIILELANSYEYMRNGET